MKRRKLTPKEHGCRRDYTRIVKFPHSYSVRLVVGAQSFTVDASTKKQEAEWMRDMLAIALAKINPSRYEHTKATIKKEPATDPRSDATDVQGMAT